MCSSKTCCCCIELKAGCLIIGYWNLVTLYFLFIHKVCYKIGVRVVTSSVHLGINRENCHNYFPNIVKKKLEVSVKVPRVEWFFPIAKNAQRA